MGTRRQVSACAGYRDGYGKRWEEWPSPVSPRPDGCHLPPFNSIFFFFFHFFFGCCCCCRSPDYLTQRRARVSRVNVPQYLDAITRAWGDWALFQQLLAVLRKIGDRHGGATIANVAVRWVLDHSFVGAVLVGA